MEKPFDDLHVGIESQLLNSPEHIPDSAAVSAARKGGDTVDGLIALGKALSWQLRYRQAILAYTQALKMDPDNRTVLRLRAGRTLGSGCGLCGPAAPLGALRDAPDVPHRHFDGF